METQNMTRSKRQGFAVGDKVICNGYHGTVTRVCEWNDGLIEVRLSSGDVCVSDDEATVQRTK